MLVQRFAAKRSGGFGTLNCLYPARFIRCTTVYIRTSPAIFFGAVQAHTYREGHPIIISHLRRSSNINDIMLKKTSYPKML
jgi:hypothetical protein